MERLLFPVHPSSLIATPTREQMGAEASTRGTEEAVTGNVSADADASERHTILHAHATLLWKFGRVLTERKVEGDFLCCKVFLSVDVNSCHHGCLSGKDPDPGHDMEECLSDLCVCFVCVCVEDCVCLYV